MFSALKFIFHFIISYLILNITISSKPLFYHINSSLSPIVSKFITVFNIVSQESIDKSKKKIKKAITTSNTKKAPSHAHSDYTVKEKELLKKLLNKK